MDAPRDRTAQRSLTLRRVLRPFTVETESGRHRLAPGVFLATMLSVNNTRAGTKNSYSSGDTTWKAISMS